jgi:hypothetical protein
MKLSRNIEINNSPLQETFTLLLKIFSIKNFRFANKIKEVSNLLNSFLIFIFEKAKKLAKIGNRKKLTFYDLINSIGENEIFQIKINRPNNYRVFQKNKKILLHDSKYFIYPDEIFKEISKKSEKPYIFQNWFKISQKKRSLSDTNSLDNFTTFSLNETIFICYIFNFAFSKRISERKLSLAIISTSCDFRNIFIYFLSWTTNFLSNNVNIKGFFMGLKIIHTIIINNSLFLFNYYKKIISILADLIFKKSIQINYKRVKGIIVYSYGLLKSVERLFFKAPDFFFIKLKWFFMKKLFKLTDNEKKNPKKILIFYNINKFTNELFLNPFFNNLMKKKRFLDKFN